jgi:hypothetical protein
MAQPLDLLSLTQTTIPTLKVIGPPVHVYYGTMIRLSGPHHKLRVRTPTVLRLPSDVNPQFESSKTFSFTVTNDVDRFITIGQQLEQRAVEATLQANNISEQLKADIQNTYISPHFQMTASGMSMHALFLTPTTYKITIPTTTPSGGALRCKIPDNVHICIDDEFKTPVGFSLTYIPPSRITCTWCELPIHA